MTKIMSMNSIAKITGHSSILDQVICSPKTQLALRLRRHTQGIQARAAPVLQIVNLDERLTFVWSVLALASPLRSMMTPLTCPKISVRRLLVELSRRDGLSSIEPDLLSNASRAICYASSFSPAGPMRRTPLLQDRELGLSLIETTTEESADVRHPALLLLAFVLCLLFFAFCSSPFFSCFLVKCSLLKSALCLTHYFIY